MTVTYTNRRKDVYYLHHGKTKTGKTRYHFSKNEAGNLVKSLPKGYEIYEHPKNAQVFLRKKQPQMITKKEQHLIDKHLKNHKTSNSYIFDIKSETITIYESNQNKDAIISLFEDMIPIKKMNSSEAFDFFHKFATYDPVMRFILIDKKQRIFHAERFCFRSSIDDWIRIGEPALLEKLLSTYVKHLGEESLFDIYF